MVQVIAIHPGVITQLDVLPPRHVFDTPIGEVIFHNNPSVEYASKGAPVRNFDILLDFQTWHSPTSKQFFRLLPPNQTYALPAISKYEQALVVDEFNKNGVGYLTRPTIYDRVKFSPTEHASHMALAPHIPHGVTLVLKPSYGASGSRQIMIPSHALQTIRSRLVNTTKAELMDKFPDIVISANTEDDEVIFTATAECVVTEYVHDIESEYRVLFGGKFAKGMARNRPENGTVFPQANLLIKDPETFDERVLLPLDELLGEVKANTLRDFIGFINEPFGSIDVYITKDGNMGIMEWSRQYAYANINPEHVREIMLAGVESILLGLDPM